MRKKKKKYGKWIKIAIPICLVFLLGISLLVSRKLTKGESLLKDGVVLIQKISMIPFTSLNKDKGKTQTESYVIQKNMNASLETEIEELKEMLELNRTLTEFTPVNATILSRNKSYWMNTITIDKGKKHGLKEGMAVVTKKGLIGKLQNVSHLSSEVKLITSDDVNFKVSVAIRTNGVDNYAILNGYDEKSNCIQVTGIDKTTEIHENDVVVTSGLGSVFPAGIYIGTVEKVESDKYNLSKIVSVKTYQNFHDIHYVTVLKEKK